MITPELLNYIKVELAKGRTRDELHKELMADGGWTEGDLNEAWRIAIPMQAPIIYPITAPIQNKFITPSPSVVIEPPLRSFPREKSSSRVVTAPHKSHSKVVLIILALILLALSGWFFRAPILNLWNQTVAKFENFSLPTTNKTVIEIPVIPSHPVVVTPPPSILDCGVGTSPKMGVPNSYLYNSTLSCLGQAAANCESARGVLTDEIFPSIFEVIKSGDSCNFKLSYPLNSSLLDDSGKRLAGQSISCPLSIVKAMDVSNPKSPKFTKPNIANVSKYGSDIFLYGIIGVFTENNLDLNKIQSLSCSGEYINEVISSFQK